MTRAAWLPFFQWCDQTAIGVWIRESTWVFPFIEVFHILALTLLLGTTFAVNFRLLNLGLRRQPVSRLAGNLWPWMQGSLAVILFSGILLFLSEAMKCFGNDAFWFKMTALTMALVFHFTAFRIVSASDDDGRVPRAVRALVAIVSIGLWLSVGAAGRAIGFV
jgi:hypothetical protein